MNWYYRPKTKIVIMYSHSCHSKTVWASILIPVWNTIEDTLTTQWKSVGSNVTFFWVNFHLKHNKYVCIPFLSVCTPDAHWYSVSGSVYPPLALSRSQTSGAGEGHKRQGQTSHLLPVKAMCCLMQEQNWKCVTRSCQRDNILLLRGIVETKMNFLSLFTCPHVIPIQYVFSSIYVYVFTWIFTWIFSLK